MEGGLYQWKRKGGPIEGDVSAQQVVRECKEDKLGTLPIRKVVGRRGRGRNNMGSVPMFFPMFFLCSFLFSDYLESGNVHVALGLQGHRKVNVCSAMLLCHESFSQVSLRRGDR